MKNIINQNNEKKLIAYITAALPDSQFTIDLALSLAENGVDSLELGVPFSDPVADGAVIESANLRSLKAGFRFDNLYEISEKIASKIDTIWMGYANPFHKIGIDYTCEKARTLGISGLIIPDVPFEESGFLAESCERNNIALIRFISPTTPKKRITTIAPLAKKFIYLLAYAGITGSGREESLTPSIEAIRECTATPIYLGFGVNEQNARQKASEVDGVIVGSAFVKILLDDSIAITQKIVQVSSIARRIKEIINS
ncbi:MAG: tryptophan synthase subunit alpha [Wolinella sp.]